MSSEASTTEQTSEQPLLRAVWSRPVLRGYAASQAEQHSAIAPDGLGDQLS